MIQKFLKEYNHLPNSCYNRIDKFRDNDGSIIAVGYDLIIEKKEDYEKNIIDKYSNKLIGKYISIKRDKLDKPKYYRIESLDNMDYHFIKVRQIKKSFIFSDVVVSKKTVLNNFKTVTEKQILKNTGWHKRKNFKYKEKYLYFFVSELGRTKIGQAINVEHRRKSIEMQSGMKIKILNAIENCANYETILHKKFKDFKHICEWFNLDCFQVDKIIKLNKENIKSFINSP